MNFAIRDDDISYWTDPSELESVYSEIFGKKVVVSFSVIPFAVKSFFPGERKKFYQDETERPVGENRELVEYLNRRIAEGKASITLHGYSHLKKIAVPGEHGYFSLTKDNIEQHAKHLPRGKLISLSEYRWKSYEQLKEETAKGKKHLEDTFSRKINVFVPPGNDISREGAKAVSECGLNLSGTMRIVKFNRKIDFYNLKNWTLKLFWRLAYNRVYPYVMDYGSHRELCAYGLISGKTIDELKDEFLFCFKKNAPFVLAVHHWELLKNPPLLEVFKQFLEFVFVFKNISFRDLNSLYGE
ncbi:DUF2334 domain-containing protein [bacterium]|jgi:predicted deacetylase|nr:DUF2334 domain-containing protein [bacterium]